MDLDRTQEINVKDTLEEQKREYAASHPPKQKKSPESQSSASQKTSSSGKKSSSGTHKKRRLSKKALKRRRRRRIKRIFHMTVILALIIALIVVIGQGLKKKKAVEAAEESAAAETIGTEKLTEADFPFTMSADRQKIGTSAILEELADYQGFRLRYPVTGNQIIDAAILSRANDIVSIFKNEVHELYSEGVIMTLCGDYAISEWDGNYVSVLFDYNVKLPQDGLSGEKMETYSYDLNTGAEVALSDVLTSGYLGLFQEKLQEYADTLQGTQISSNMTADDKNFKIYMWSNEGLTFYFLPGTIIENGTETLSLTIPMEDLADYFNTEE